MSERSLEDLSHEELVAHARKGDEGNKLFQALLADPKTRGETLKLVKAKNPNMAIPELDSASVLEERLAKEREEREKTEARVREMEIKQRIKDDEEKIAKKYEFSEADMVEVRKLLVGSETEPAIPNWDAAAKVYKASQVLAKPTSAAIQSPMFEMPGKDVWAKGIGNRAELNKVATNLAFDALNQFRAGKAA